MHLRNSIQYLKMGKQVNKFMNAIFLDSVSSVKPKNLILEHFELNKNEDKLRVFSDYYDLRRKKVYLVGAGKAVLEMATEVEHILGDRLKGGIVSIPTGITERFPLNSQSIIKFYEGAENNMPDLKSEYATKQITTLVKNLDKDCILLVLLSGGGSALLTSPLPTVSLQEKCQLIKQLSQAGADIVEMNTVRKRLSAVKGGKLAELAYPAQIITCLILDIVGNQPGSVASGPTFQNKDEPSEAIGILRKYSLCSTLSKSINHVLHSSGEVPNIPWNDLNVSNYVLGNNTCALDVGYQKATSEGYKTILLSDQVQGDIDDLSKEYTILLSTVIKLLSNSIDKNMAKSVFQNLKNILIHSDVMEELLEVNLENLSRGLCLIAGGEPTVRVTGSGKGGRSQHLALSVSYNYHLEKLETEELKNFNMSILCAGTDGMDGPTDAAGAIGNESLVTDSENQCLSIQSYILNNDSYNFFTRFSNGKNHIKIGHTNTNVMDIHIIVISAKNM